MVIGFDASRAFVAERTGTENYSYQLLKALAKIDRKNQYRIYLRPSQAVIARNEMTKQSRDRHALLAMTKREWPSNFQFKVIFWPRLWTQGGLASECLINPPDVLFIPAHTLPVIRHPGLKTVVTIHDLGAEYLPQYHKFPQKYYLNWSTVYAVRNATRIIAVSKNTKKDLITKLHCDISKACIKSRPFDVEVIRVIYEGVNSEELRVKSLGQDSGDILKKYGIQKPYILFVGTIQPRKNIAMLIEAFARLTHVANDARQPSSRSRSEVSSSLSERRSPKVKAIPDSEERSVFSSFASDQARFLNMSLVLVGKPGWLYDEIYQAPKKYGVEERVRFLNFVSDDELAVLYQEASVFCLPSLYEGFGLPVLEAMAAGVPVVASNTSSLPEVVGQAGILVDPLDVNSIAQGLHRVLTDRKFREKLVIKGRERVEQFRWEKTARETVKVLEEVYEQA